MKYNFRIYDRDNNVTSEIKTNDPYVSYLFIDLTISDYYMDELGDDVGCLAVFDPETNKDIITIRTNDNYGLNIWVNGIKNEKNLCSAEVSKIIKEMFN